MKKLLDIFILSGIILILNSCAKPTVVEIVQPNDDKLNCEELKIEIAEVQKIKEEAVFSKDSGGNYARVILFWPAWAQSLHNADEAILAANDRKHHLIKIMKKKKCKGAEKLEANIKDKPATTTSVSQENIAEQLKTLKELYDSGDLTEEEYKKAKDKVIN
tara:strand:+ start:881 stop:1363 length:483 start_codon:yes stop_codon:yes gene_type:complete